MGMILEVCVDTQDGLEAAIDGGADRIELCAALALGGLTPSAGFMAVAESCGLPVMAMIRPRAGDFVYSDSEAAQMEADISTACSIGLAGVVFGANLPDGRLDTGLLRRLRQAARGADCTLHRAFDLVPDMEAALETAIALGFSRILTSGGAATAVEGAARIAALVKQARGRISIMPGSGVTSANAGGLAALGIKEIHGSCAVPVAMAGRAVDLGFGPATQRRTDAAMVRALRQAVD
jgi:copper homeostasis protein